MEKKNSAAVIAVAVLVIIVAGIIVLTVQKDPDTAIPVLSGSGAPVNLPVVVTTIAVIPVIPRPIVLNISEEEATSRLREEYPEGQYTLASISVTDRYPGKVLYECAMVPAKGSIFDKNATFFVDTSTGDLYSPSQENAGITIEQAKDFARHDFPEWTIDRIRIRFYDGSNYNRGWKFELMNNNATLIDGGLDAGTGELSWYGIGATRMGRPEVPSITMDSARVTADNEIRKWNGELPLELTESRYDSLGMHGEKIAGYYVFVYKRIIRNVPCDSDGLILMIDSVTGNVLDYHKHWTLPENAIAASYAPAISRDAAVALVEKEARARYPESASSLKVISADLRWMDLHNADKITPGPGSIPLAWKVMFDDETIRAQQYPIPEHGWVDAQNGNLLDLYYYHQQ